MYNVSFVKGKLARIVVKKVQVRFKRGQNKCSKKLYINSDDDDDDGDDGDGDGDDDDDDNDDDDDDDDDDSNDDNEE